MFHLLLAVIYLSFISLGLPDSLLGAAWPSMYGEFGVPVSYASAVFMQPSRTEVSSGRAINLRLKGCRAQRRFLTCTSAFFMLCTRADINAMSYVRAVRASCPPPSFIDLHMPQYSALYSMSSFTNMCGLSG